jgi:hypothetical protein
MDTQPPFQQQPPAAGDETTSTDEKAITTIAAPSATHAEGRDGEHGAESPPPSPQRLQPPEVIAKMTPEEREALEKRLKRKIDLRLLPAVIIMYIMNYIDR